FQRHGKGLSLAGQIDPWQIGELLGVAGLQLGIEGLASGEFSVDTRTGSLEASARISMGPGRIRSFAVDSAGAEVSVRDGFVNLLPLTVRLGGGDLMVNGTLAPRRGSA